MRSLPWLLGFAGITPLACIKAPPPGPEAPTQSRPVVASTAEVKALLDQAQRAVDAERYAEARDLALRALELTKTVRVAPRMLATLHETEGWARWRLEDLDAQAPFETALALWERIPGAEGDVARVCERLAATLAFPVVELERAEGLLRRSIELTTKADPTNTVELLNAHYILLDVLDQECRTADALPLIETADSIVKSQHPIDPENTAAIFRIRGTFAARAGDIPGAIEWLKRELEELTRAGSNARVLDQMDVCLDLLACLERDRGNYEAARTFVERRVELATKRPQSEFVRWLERDFVQELHWVYAATRDPRLAAHEAKNELASFQAGEALFPKHPPAKGACRPEEKPYQGWLNRYDAISERVEPCLKDQSNRGEEHPIQITFRTVNGKVVAAEAVGRRADPSVVRCIAETALGYEHPTAKYNEFGSASLE